MAPVSLLNAPASYSLNVNAPLSKLLCELCYAAIIWVAWESGLDLIPAHLKVIYQEIDDRKHLLSDLNGAVG